MLKTLVEYASPVQILFVVTAPPFGTRPAGIAARRVTMLASGSTSTMARAPSEPLKFPEQGAYSLPSADARTDPGFWHWRPSLPPRSISVIAPVLGTSAARNPGPAFTG